MVGLEIAPDDLDVVEFRGVFGQPLDGEPMGAFSERCKRNASATGSASARGWNGAKPGNGSAERSA
jgi:hypothetical protein